ncbi:hypothetical protein [Sutcliffiella horikoshii]|uniref:hypothetical protein n=1 Tax=Sutcliffiella horikoshii TaxID=79883 RepID=UPI00384C4814
MYTKTKEFVRHILFRISNKHSKGYTNFAPLRIAPEYTNIDLENKQVTGVVKYNDRVYLTVTADVGLNKTTVKGSLRGISHITKPFNKSNYIAMIKSHAELLINKEERR